MSLNTTNVDRLLDIRNIREHDIAYAIATNFRTVRQIDVDQITEYIAAIDARLSQLRIATYVADWRAGDSWTPGHAA